VAGQIVGESAEGLPDLVGVGQRLFSLHAIRFEIVQQLLQFCVVHDGILLGVSASRLLVGCVASTELESA
jgi:hypothetical protein